jgi:nucleoside-diphosphate-sugar epimerase
MGEGVVLLTGGTGFIGMRVKALLVSKGYSLRVMSRTPHRPESYLTWFVGDITDGQACREAMRGVDFVIHAAGEKGKIARFHSVNVQGTENLLENAAENGIKRFIHVSSVGVIGADPLQQRIVTEDIECTPRNPYEESKYKAEQKVQQAVLKGFPAVILRPANVFGDQDPQKGLLNLARSIRYRKFVYLGSRASQCNFVFVEDVAHAIVTLMECPIVKGRVYHISDHCLLGDFVDALADEIGGKKPRLQLPGVLTGTLRKALKVSKQIPLLSQLSMIDRLVALNNQTSFVSFRLTDELGYRYLVGWREGLKRMVKWYREQGEL